MASSPSISFVLPNKNNAPVLGLFFDRLQKHTDLAGIQMVAIDDGSTDGSQQILRRWRDSGVFRSFVLREQACCGVPVTVNRCLALADGDLIVRLDGDATVEADGWLEAMVELWRAGGEVGLVVAGIVYDSGRIHSLGRSVVCAEGLHDRGTTIAEPAGARTLDSAVRRPGMDEVAWAGSPAEVDTALGCCTLFSAQLARDVGGIDEALGPTWIEDDDFGMAARRLGYKNFCLPDAAVVHRLSMRNPRRAQPARERAASAINRRVGRLLPERIKRTASATAKVGDREPWREQLLRRHYAHWQQKWGFDPLNPDLGEVRRRYGGSEIWWAADEARRSTGSAILARYAAKRAETAAAEAGR